MDSESENSEMTGEGDTMKSNRNLFVAAGKRKKVKRKTTKSMKPRGKVGILMSHIDMVTIPI